MQEALDLSFDRLLMMMMMMMMMMISVRPASLQPLGRVASGYRTTLSVVSGGEDASQNDFEQHVLIGRHKVRKYFGFFV